MKDPSSPGGVPQLAAPPTSPPLSPEQELKARQSRLSFSATIAAVKSGCGCEACRLLREAVTIMLVQPSDVGGQNASVHDSSPGGGAPPSVA